jgi:hypothetical protein
MPRTFAIYDGQTCQFTVIVLDIKLSGSLNDVVKVLHRDLDDVILGIINDTDGRRSSLLDFAGRIKPRIGLVGTV